MANVTGKLLIAKLEACHIDEKVGVFVKSYLNSWFQRVRKRKYFSSCQKELLKLRGIPSLLEIPQTINV